MPFPDDGQIFCVTLSRVAFDLSQNLSAEIIMNVTKPYQFYLDWMVIISFQLNCLQTTAYPYHNCAI